jgi:hypothetical protein
MEVSVTCAPSVITLKAVNDYHFKTANGRRQGLNSSTLPASGQASLIKFTKCLPGSQD